MVADNIGVADIEGVRYGSAINRVISQATNKNFSVQAATARNGVVERRAPHFLKAHYCVLSARTIGGALGLEVDGHASGVLAIVEHVVASTAVQAVTASATEKGVITASTRQGVIAAHAFDLVVAVIARKLVVVQERSAQVFKTCERV